MWFWMVVVLNDLRGSGCTEARANAVIQHFSIWLDDLAKFSKNKVNINKRVYDEQMRAHTHTRIAPERTHL